jgi:hypothetical protein
LFLFLNLLNWFFLIDTLTLFVCAKLLVLHNWLIFVFWNHNIYIVEIILALIMLMLYVTYLALLAFCRTFDFTDLFLLRLLFTHFLWL